MTRFILRAVPERQDFVDYLAARIPGLEVVMDEKRDAFETFRRALKLAGEDPVVHLEEDILLTRDFVAKVEREIEKKPLRMVQFFSMRKPDLTIGSRWDDDFLMAQAYYVPATYSRLQLAYYPVWAADKLRKAKCKSDEERAAWRKKNHGSADLMLKDWLKHRREKYWIHCPSLVDHRVAKSAIDPRRSSKRQSFTFTDPWL